MAKALGSDIVDFYRNGWPKGFYCDESNLVVTDEGQIVPESAPVATDGDYSVPLEDKYELDDFGVIINEKTGAHFDFSHFFNKWKKARSVVSLIVEVPISKEDEITGLLKTAGCKIRK
jgi:hypothetical protein